jgi:dephospho-CoA kinase
MLVIGLTGGIASGKTTVAEFFSKEGIEIIDADIGAHEVVRPQTNTLKKIVAHFGKEILSTDHTLNRQALRKIILNNAKEKKWLEDLLHPLIRDWMKEKINQAQSPYCIAAIPLLIETLPNPLIDRILVIDCKESFQIKNLMARDHCTEAEAQLFLKNQATRDERLKQANDVIQNDQDADALNSAVKKLHEQYIELAVEY